MFTVYQSRHGPWRDNCERMDCGRWNCGQVAMQLQVISRGLLQVRTMWGWVKSSCWRQPKIAEDQLHEHAEERDTNGEWLTWIGRVPAGNGSTESEAAQVRLRIRSKYSQEPTMSVRKEDAETLWSTEVKTRRRRGCAQRAEWSSNPTTAARIAAMQQLVGWMDQGTRNTMCHVLPKGVVLEEMR